MNTYDKQLMETLIGLYNEIDEQIRIAGEDTIREHDPEMFLKRGTIKGFITHYAQRFCHLTLADEMSVSEIAEFVGTKNEGRK